MSAVTESKSNLGLEGLGDVGNLLSETVNEVVEGKPIELDLDLVDEDPNQPRDEYDEVFLKELSVSIKKRGVKTPISVRENPDEPGRYIINHGHCRTRSSRMAGKKSIPAFIDNDYNEDDQVVENIQRNNLTPRQIANYIGRKKSEGFKNGEIAKAISKSNAYVTQHAALLDLPEPIASVFNSGQCNDVTVVNELVKAYKADSGEVETWLEENQDFSRDSVKKLREFIDDKKTQTDLNQEDDDNGGKGEKEKEEPKKSKTEDPDKLKKAIVLVLHENRSARMILNRRPSSDGMGWFKYEDDGEEFECDLGEIQLTAVIEG